jgi:hypothetical protein
MGVKVMHEKPGPDGSVSWPMAVSDAYVNRVYPWSGLKEILGPDELLFTHVVHVVRCPVDNIAALTSHTHVSRGFIKSAGLPAPARKADSEKYMNELIAWASLAWIAWNEHVERYADYRFQTESLSCADGERHLHTTLWRSGFGDGRASSQGAKTSSSERILFAPTPQARHNSTFSNNLDTDNVMTRLNVRSHIRGIDLGRISRAFNESGYAQKYVPGLGPNAGELVVERLQLMARAYGYGDRCLTGQGPVGNCSSPDGSQVGRASEGRAGFFDIMG